MIRGDGTNARGGAASSWRRCITRAGAALWAIAASHATAQAAPPVPPAATDTTPAPPAVPAGRADENAVRQTENAFGTTIGRETIGIYSSGSVRGFSPIAAGNARIAGLYFDQASPPNSRIRRSSSIKVGRSAQGYLFPAPTGVVDYALRRPSNDALLSATIGANSFGDKNLELDAELPLARDTLSLGAGLALFDHVFQNGTTSFQHVEGLTLRWRPRPGIEITPFYGRSYIDDDEIGPLLPTAGPYLPPRIERSVFYGSPWMDYSGPTENAGIVGEAAFGAWRLEAGVFRSLVASQEDIFTFLDDITPDGRARFIAFSDPPYRRASLSGELRLTRAVAEGPRTHALTISARARSRNDRTGGSAFLDFGDVRLGDPLVFPEPPITYGAYSRDRVRQWTGGVAYVVRWRDVGELSLGLSKTDYAKRIARPGRPVTETRDRPWLYNAAGAIYATRDIAVYAGYTRGLEETGLPPQTATNRNIALPTILTSQRDAGIRWRRSGDVKLVAGVFDVRKPYLSLDPTGLFTTLGDTRNRGIEASLSGTPVKGLSVALGGVFLDPQVIGAARALGRTGKRPVGIPLRSVDLNLDWRLPWDEALSLDLGVNNQGRVASTVDTALFIPSRTLVDVGGRYRFSLVGREATLRVSVSNLLDTFAWDYRGPSTFEYISQRLVTAYLAADF